MGRHCKGGVHMEMSAALNMDDIWKDSRAAGVRPNFLQRALTPET